MFFAIPDFAGAGNLLREGFLFFLNLGLGRTFLKSLSSMFYFHHLFLLLNAVRFQGSMQAINLWKILGRYWQK